MRRWGNAGDGPGPGALGSRPRPGPVLGAACSQATRCWRTAWGQRGRRHGLLEFRGTKEVTATYLVAVGVGHGNRDG
eukprot:2244751-Alexandrium_andersonii.AAC.1